MNNKNDKPCPKQGKPSMWLQRLLGLASENKFRSHAEVKNKRCLQTQGLRNEQAQKKRQREYANAQCGRTLGKREKIKQKNNKTTIKKK